MSLSLNLQTPALTADAPVRQTPCPEGIPEKFWDTDAGTIRVDDLLKSYCELEKRFMTRSSQSGALPVEKSGGKNNETYPQIKSFELTPHTFADPNTRTLILKHLGRPDTPQDYVITDKNPYITLDPDLNIRLHDLGFTQDQVQAVYDLAVERLVPLILDLVTDQKAEQDIDHLINIFGGPKKWEETARQIQTYGEKHLPADLFKTLAATPEGISMLYDMMQSRLTPYALSLGAGERTGIAEKGIDQIRKMMRDPRYWRDHDPKFVEKVTAGFSRLYG